MNFAPEEYAMAYIEAVDLAIRCGATEINKLPACWEHQIDDSWWIAINGHDTETKCSTGARVPPFAVYVKFNGFPAGIILPRGGKFAAGIVVNEETFVAALRAAEAPS